MGYKGLSFFVLLFVFLSNCRIDPVPISERFQIDIDYKDAATPLHYIKRKGTDTVEEWQYFYFDSSVKIVITSKNKNKEHRWYLFNNGKSLAYERRDTGFRNTYQFVQRQLFNYDSMGFIKLKEISTGYIDSSGYRSGAKVDVRTEKIEHENVMKQSVSGLAYCQTSYVFFNSEAGYFAPDLMDPFAGRRNKNLKKEYKPGCNYPHGESSPNYSYNYVIEDGYVTRMTEIITSYSYSGNRQVTNRTATKYTFSYHHK
jgi:hypothetical protein